MERQNTKHIIAVAIAILTAVASYQSNVGSTGDRYSGWWLDVALAMLINVVVVYLIAAFIGWIRRSKKKN